MSSRGLKILRIILTIVVIVVIAYVSTGFYAYKVVSDYDNKMYPNVYINDYDISEIETDKIDEHIDKISSRIEEKTIIFVVNGKEYEYKLGDFGISVNKTELFNQIKSFRKNLSYVSKLRKVFTNEKTVFSYECSYNEEKILSFLNELKPVVDQKLINGKLVVSKDRNIYYQKGTPSFSLDVDSSMKKIVEAFPNILTTNKIELVGVSIQPTEDKTLSLIDTKLSSFTTKFDNTVSRAENLRNAARYIDGAVIKPGETFSFYKYAGPYAKKGYVYYNGVIGNGVCQVASTMYNAELLAGLQTVERYSHAYKMQYVQGGLDATVSSTTTSNKLDFKFKNIYKYPIYISAFTNGGTITIEIWSNSKATGGKTFKTQSIQVGYNGYKTYLLTYKDGKQISKTGIATTWYPQ